MTPNLRRRARRKLRSHATAIAGALTGTVTLPNVGVRIQHRNCIATERLARRAQREQPFVEAFLDTIDDGDVVWDIGACLGLYSIAASYHEPRATIHAFEAHPVNAQLLFHHAREASFRAHDYALSDRDGIWAMPPITPGAGDAQLVPAGQGSHEVHACAGRDLALPLDPTHLKIDVGNHMLEVLEGLGDRLDGVQHAFIEPPNTRRPRHTLAQIRHTLADTDLELAETWTTDDRPRMLRFQRKGGSP
jgi:FkbM family methyltransferase